jgi:O-antigen/teichoic acid export membrane protein
MSGYSWLGVLVSTFVSTLALGGYLVMAVPYFDNAPYLTDLKKNIRLALLVGSAVFAVFFAIFYLSALYVDQDTSGPLLIMIAVVVSLPVSMLLGSETWEHYRPKQMDRAPGLQAVTVATGIGLAELAGSALVFVALFHVG